jgi:hypothetical protein
MKIKLLVCFSLFSLSSFTQISVNIKGESPFDLSGKSVSISANGSIVAIGSYLNDKNGERSGQVRIYQKKNDAWIQLGPNINGEAIDDQSGISISLSADGNMVAIGASGNNGENTNHDQTRICDYNQVDYGHVRVYKYKNNNWTQIGSDIDGEDADDRSGISVSLSADGSALAIGAIGNDSNGTNSGHVRVYKNISGVWTQIGSDIDGEATGDMSGYSISLSGDASTVAIGAIGNDSNGTDSGHVRIFKNRNNIWSQIGSDIEGEKAGDKLGASVSISYNGTIVAIGAIGNDSNGTDSGHVRVFQNNNDTWTQIGADIEGKTAGDQFGYAVSLSNGGNILAIGATSNNDNGVNSGQVRMYHNISGSWVKIGNDMNGKTAGDGLGESISISSDGTTIAIGAINNDDNGINSGIVTIYTIKTPRDVPSPNDEEQCAYSIINSEDFESGWGIWNDGGSDSYRAPNSTYATTGTYSMRLRDNSTSSVATTNALDLTSYEEITIDFSYYCRSMDNSNEGFWLQMSIDGGQNFTTTQTWYEDINFVNNQHYSEQIIIPGPFTANTKFRFKADASSNDDFVHIDDVVINGCSQPSCVLNSESFESGWGIWNDGGSDSYRAANSTYATTGNYSIRLRDNSTSSVVTTDALDLSFYEEIIIDFSHYCRSMDNSNEGFWLQMSIDGGQNFTTIQTWNKDIDFINNQHYSEQIIIPGPFTVNTKFRFKADASSNDDFVHIDDVVISGCNATNSTLSFTQLNTNTLETENIIIPTKITSILYPNPFSEQINIKLNGAYSKAEVTIFNLLGQPLYSKIFYNNETIKIPTVNLPNGQYLIKIQLNETLIIKKAIKRDK